MTLIKEAEEAAPKAKKPKLHVRKHKISYGKKEESQYKTGKENPQSKLQNNNYQRGSRNREKGADE